MTLLIAVGIGLGGALGALMRALAGRWIRCDFPLATLLVNVIGSFLFAAAITGLPLASGPLHAFIGAGFCGAFTTFSTFILEAVLLFRSGWRRQAILYILLTLGLCCLASWTGFYLIT